MNVTLGRYLTFHVAIISAAELYSHYKLTVKLYQQHSFSVSFYSTLKNPNSTRLRVHRLYFFSSPQTTMSAHHGLPSLLVFGPQTEFSSEEILSDLRLEIVSNPHLSALRDGVADLPRFWHNLVSSDPSLRSVPGAKNLTQLAQWVANGGPFPHGGEPGAGPPNHYSMAVTVLLQISQYARYLGHLGSGKGGEDAHRSVLGAVGAGGGIQGFCVGFLSAVAAATAKTESDLGAAAAVALRLAVCIGAHVDHDGIFAEKPIQTSCVAVRWKEGTGVGNAEVEKITRSYSQVRKV